MGREADQRTRPGALPRLGDRGVILADMCAVGPAGGDQVGPVVEDEQRAVLPRSPPKRSRQLDQPLVASLLLLAHLDDVDAAAKRRVEQRPRVRAAGTGLADEVEARLVEPRASHPPQRLAS